jgi:hypothetical protein
MKNVIKSEWKRLLFVSGVLFSFGMTIVLITIFSQAALNGGSILVQINNCHEMKLEIVLLSLILGLGVYSVIYAIKSWISG